MGRIRKDRKDMDKYKKKLAEYEQKLKNYDSFDYNAEADELFRLQRAQIERDQRDGVSDVLARYAANTGMTGSSAAMTAAQQTASKYDNMVADALTAAEERAYSRWERERSELESAIAATKQDAYNEAETRLSFGDLSGYEGLGYDTSIYKSELEKKTAESAREKALEDAKLRASLGDFSGYRDLGYDTSKYEADLAAKVQAEEKEKKLAEAKLRAQYGDYSLLRELGIDLTTYEAELAGKAKEEEYAKKLAEAKLRAQYGDYSLLRELGVNTSAYESEQAKKKAEEEYQSKLAEAKLRAQYGDYTMLRELGYDTSEYEADRAREKEIEEANIKKNVMGANGMTREDFEVKISEYDAEIAQLGNLGFYSQARSLETQKERLIREYYNIGVTESASDGRVVTVTPAPAGDELTSGQAQALINGYINGKPISLEDYERLAWYYRDRGGKSYLYSIGVISEGVDGAYMM